jgi:4-hydroxy-tetrahydrodipicolinate synthase
VDRNNTYQEKELNDMKSDLVLSGVIPANLLPFDENLNIDEINYRRHIRYIIDTDGVTGLTTNGHAAEVATLTLEEQQKSLSITVDEVAGKVPVVCGVYADGTEQAIKIAKMAEREGADCLLIFPSNVFNNGFQLRPEMAYKHYAAIASATHLPLISFVYPEYSGLAIKTDTLVKICNDIDNVIAIKEWSNDIVTYERNFRELRKLDKKVSVLTSFSKSLLASLCIGADGILSGHGSLIADLQVALFAAVKRGDLFEARRISETIYPLADVFYAEPFLDGHNRMKTANAMLGRISKAYVRPPLQTIQQSEQEIIRRVITGAGLPAITNSVKA